MTDVGTHALFETLLHQHGATVRGVCRSILRDEHLGADAAQEAFVRLWSILRDGRPSRRPKCFGAWLRRVAVRTSLDALRTARARSRAHERAPLAAGRSEPSSSAQDAELREHYERALETLPEGQRTVFVLRNDANLALSEVARTLDLALPTVKTQFARAALTLSRRLRAFAPADTQPPPAE